MRQREHGQTVHCFLVKVFLLQLIPEVLSHYTKRALIMSDELNICRLFNIVFM